MACSTCPGSAKPAKAAPTAFARSGMRVTVTSETEVQALMKKNPGYTATRTNIGPMNIVLTLVPRARR